jgi:hypothetical protein
MIRSIIAKIRRTTPEVPVVPPLSPEEQRLLSQRKERIRKMREQRRANSEHAHA